MLRHAEPDFPKINLVLIELKKKKGPMKWKMACVSLGVFCIIFVQKKKSLLHICIIKIPFSSCKVSSFFFFNGLSCAQGKYKISSSMMRLGILGWSSQPHPSSSCGLKHVLLPSTWRRIFNDCCQSLSLLTLNLTSYDTHKTTWEKYYLKATSWDLYTLWMFAQTH